MNGNKDLSKKKPKKQRYFKITKWRKSRVENCQKKKKNEKISKINLKEIKSLAGQQKSVLRMSETGIIERWISNKLGKNIEKFTDVSKDQRFETMKTLAKNMKATKVSQKRSFFNHFTRKTVKRLKKLRN